MGFVGVFEEAMFRTQTATRTTSKGGRENKVGELTDYDSVGPKIETIG